jgi:hypothetical protein
MSAQAIVVIGNLRQKRGTLPRMAPAGDRHRSASATPGTLATIKPGAASPAQWSVVAVILRMAAAIPT